MSLLRERAEQGELEPEMIGPAAQVIALAVRGYQARWFRRHPGNWDTSRDAFVTSLVSVVTRGMLARAG